MDDSPATSIPEKPRPKDLQSGLFTVFYHLSTPKSADYRAILRVFALARERFEIALRPAEVANRVVLDSTWSHTLNQTEPEVEACLSSLRDWGNLAATRDIVSARTISEYLHPRFLYQLTPAGEMAERSLVFFDEGLRSRGELSTSALRDIGEGLEELRRLLDADPVDEAKAIRGLRDLARGFDHLVTRAQSFIGSLQHELDRPGAEESAFLALKEELIAYLDRFVRELISSTYRVGTALRALDSLPLASLLDAVADADLANVLAPTSEDRTHARGEWQARWQGLRRWFIGHDGAMSQSDALRARAVAAIPTLLERVRRIHDQRANRADRATDFHTLARWFADAPTEADLHRLWRAAFALSPARHLRVNPATLAQWEELADGTRPAWEDAPPFVISIAQWERGQVGPRGASPHIINRTAARSALRAQAKAERLALLSSRRALAARTPATLGELAELDLPQFDVLLDAIGEAFAQLGPEDIEAEATSTDGDLLVKIRLPSPRSTLATLRTPDGDLIGPDLRVEVNLIEEEVTPEDHS